VNQQQLMNRVVSAAIWQLMRRAPTWLLIIIVGGAFLMAFAHGQTGPITCTDWQGVRTCQDPYGYISRESTWQGTTTGDDNAGNKWSTRRWHDQTIIERR